MKTTVLIHVVAILAALLFTGQSGCTQRSSDAPESHTSTSHQHSSSSSSMHHPDARSHAEGGKHAEQTEMRSLAVTTDPSSPTAGTPTTLTLKIRDTDGTNITQFDILHEKLVHLILVREGLDEFAHLHPDVDSDGTITVQYTFPKSGIYRLFADHSPRGGTPGVARGIITVSGEDAHANPLKATVPGTVSINGISAKVSISDKDNESVVRFELGNADGGSIQDLQPYLGAMGHLVVISEDGNEYVHAHPLGSGMSAPAGVVDFAAHFPRSGIFKGWGQFQRQDAVFTVPFVLEHHGAQSQHHE